MRLDAGAKHEGTQNSTASSREQIKNLNRKLLELEQADVQHELEESSSDDEARPAATSMSQVSATNDQAPQIRQRKVADANTKDDTTIARTSATSLFSKPGKTAENVTHSADRETLLNADRTEQEAIKNSLVTLARQLKASSQAFGASLEGEKLILNQAETGLDKNAMGMEAAEKRMGRLRRMTEDRGWFRRIKLYAIIAAMWLGAFLLVFIGPKLRF